MSLILRQIHSPDQRLDLRQILPEKLQHMDLATLAGVTISVGNRKQPLATLFAIEGKIGEAITIIPLSNDLDRLGANMQSGLITIQGTAGDYAGAAMQGGKLLIEGDAGLFTGSSLQGGKLIVNGNAGDYVGAPTAGLRRGQAGGYIHIRGNAGNWAGERQRRGLLIIDGNCGDLTGHQMIAGTIYVGGKTGELTGLGMRRGTILVNSRPDKLPTTINRGGRQKLPYLTLLLRDLKHHAGDHIPTITSEQKVDRFVGDLSCGGQGEIIILQ